MDWRSLIERYFISALNFSDDVPEEFHAAEQKSQAVSIIKEFLWLAQQQCVRDGLEPDDPDAISRMDEAFYIGREFAYAANGYLLSGPTEWADTPEKIRRAMSLVYWADPHGLEQEIKLNGRLKVDFSQYESAVTKYLESDLRSKDIDRFILTGLIDMELTGFLERMYKRDPITGFALGGMVNKSAFQLWIRGRLKALGISIFMSVVTYNAAYFWEAAPDWIELAGYSLSVVFFVLTTLIATVFLPFRAPKYERAMGTLRNLIDGMKTFYGEVHSDGPLSVRHLRFRLEALRDIDAVWPGSIWVLLEDIEKRGITTL